MTGRRGQLLAEVEEMIARLRKLKDHERDTRLRGVYLASIERLEGLSYRLRKPETHVIGLPARQAAPPPAPEPPQHTGAASPLSVQRGGTRARVRREQAGTDRPPGCRR